jgi:type IV secretory pathway ATPase VirB11/archaellum biosynthesis ATPase
VERHYAWSHGVTTWCRRLRQFRSAAQLLVRMIEAKLAFLFSGGTGSGKPTTALSQPIEE